MIFLKRWFKSCWGKREKINMEVDVEAVGLSMNRKKLTNLIGGYCAAWDKGDFFVLEKGGNWPEIAVPFEGTYKYQSCLHFHKTGEWGPTSYWLHYENKGGGVGMAKEKCRKFAAIYNSIKDRGWDAGSAISIHIGEKGQPIVQNGKHRLAVAKVLEISRIPCKIEVCHEDQVQAIQTGSSPYVTLSMSE